MTDYERLTTMLDDFGVEYSATHNPTDGGETVLFWLFQSDGFRSPDDPSGNNKTVAIFHFRPDGSFSGRQAIREQDETMDEGVRKLLPELD
jgi:hypothetical protein